MKGFPANPDGPRGVWYRRVNEAVATISVGTSRDRVVETLGTPDAIRPGDTTASGTLQSLMEGLAGGPTVIRYGDTTPVSELLVFHDPYRSRSYVYGITDGVVRDTWIEEGAAGPS